MHSLHTLLYRSAELGISSSIAHDVVAREGIDGLARLIRVNERTRWEPEDGPIAVPKAPEPSKRITRKKSRDAAA